jgi:hypothetical protein
VCAPAGTATQAEYAIYPDEPALRGAFRELVDEASEPLDGTDCQVGPSDISWSIPGESGGLLACFADPDQPDGLVIVWTDDDASALGLGVVPGGGYAGLYDWWLGAGLDHD